MGRNKKISHGPRYGCPSCNDGNSFPFIHAKWTPVKDHMMTCCPLLLEKYKVGENGKGQNYEELQFKLCKLGHKKCIVSGYTYDESRVYDYINQDGILDVDDTIDNECYNEEKELERKEKFELWRQEVEKERNNNNTKKPHNKSKTSRSRENKRIDKKVADNYDKKQRQQQHASSAATTVVVAAADEIDHNNKPSNNEWNKHDDKLKGGIGGVKYDHHHASSSTKKKTLPEEFLLAQNNNVDFSLLVTKLEQEIDTNDEESCCNYVVQDAIGKRNDWIQWSFKLASTPQNWSRTCMITTEYQKDVDINKVTLDKLLHQQLGGSGSYNDHYNNGEATATAVDYYEKDDNSDDDNNTCSTFSSCSSACSRSYDDDYDDYNYDHVRALHCIFHDTFERCHLPSPPLMNIQTAILVRKNDGSIHKDIKKTFEGYKSRAFRLIDVIVQNPLFINEITDKTTTMSSCSSSLLPNNTVICVPERSEYHKQHFSSSHHHYKYNNDKFPSNKII